MSTSDTTACPTLTGPENFQIWKIRITAKLRQEKVWDAVTEERPSPSPPIIHHSQSTQQHGENWSVRDSKAAGVIIAHICDRLALEVGSLPHAKEMFDKLVEIHENTNVGVSAFYTFIQMLNTKWDGSPTTLSEHIATISAADAKLTAMKKAIDREFLAFILLHSLPDDNVWESFRATVLNSAMPGKPLAFSDLSDRLTFTVTAQQGASSEAALKASAKPKQKPKSDTWCEFHRSTTHNTSECRTIKEQREKQKKGKAKAKSKANHASHGSESNDGDSEDSDSDTGGGVAKYSSTKSAHVSKALMSRILAYAGSASSSMSYPSTIADSGASTHMTPNRGWFKCGTF